MTDQFKNLNLTVQEDYCYNNGDEYLQGYNIVDSNDGKEIIGDQGIMLEGQAFAHLFAAAPDLLEALKYAKRFLKKEDVDMKFIDDAIKKATEF